MRSVLILFSLLCVLMVVFSLPLSPTSNLENSQPNKITTLADTLADPPAAEEPAAEEPAADDSSSIPLLGGLLKIISDLLGQLLGGLS
ncbi:hypothetical protein G6F55_005221 [Rhizopus delemar]|uniref:Uncharacterized protein n=1 Tax=Rhizopus delemar TaxID=936053 RepID=A0A9P6ZDF2_9FUNG|nr:hypothetical protein G6F55_005221 [Rhizopus delemar]KAG1627287.1 hypothetical protein G6F45_007763 [Rhizopus arrhizus]KAG1495250.1 hypothetical protein G6F54_007306 [Rhizopus delemar]KAG1509050.1 hypothetical protein G6F53_007738 [Rhizopus delemar]KAG1524980.1 hypothetical protein G6F52_003729 [Rhizopus delemar]